MRYYAWALGLLLFALGGCEDEADAPGEGRASPRTNLALGSEATSARGSVVEAGNDPPRATPSPERSAESPRQKPSLVLDAGLDAAIEAVVCAPLPPDAGCDAVSQCGCAAGKGCGVLGIQGSSLQLGCLPPGSIPSGSACSAETCVAGNTCVGSLCRPFCGKDTDCGSGGHCVTAVTDDANAQPIAGLGACFTGCSVDRDCATGCCRPLPSAAKAAGKLCLSEAACCAAAGAPCTATTDCCGHAREEAVCVIEPGGSALCRATCTKATDCQSGCCAPLAGGGKACVAASQCQSHCAAANESCQTSADCCGGSGGTAVCVDQGNGPLCAELCTVGAQCQSGCCAALQTGGKVCAPQTYCP